MARLSREARRAEAKAKAAADIAEGYRRGELEYACETYGPKLPPEMEAAWRDKVRADYLDHLREEAEQTGNPLFAWRAIQECHDAAYMEALHDAPSATIGLRTASLAVPKPLPDWVLRYLGQVAGALCALARQRDFRASGYNAPLTVKRAQELVPGALGLTSQGYSAFVAFATKQRADWLADDLAHLRATEGLTLDEAAARLAEIMGYRDPRNVLRIASKAKHKRVAKPKG